MTETIRRPAPSAPIPETPAHRLAITRRLQAETGLNDQVLERLVRAFYATARRDPDIGSFFDGVADWDHHIAKITAFWSSVALLTGRYHGQPLPPHMKLALRPEHFARWLELFEQTARRECSPAAVALLMERARRIAESMRLAIAVRRGEMPQRRN